MTRLTRAFAALASLALTTIAQQSQSDDIPSFEVDVIFPRNETYKETDHLPIAFVFQNMATLLAAPKIMGDPSISWSIMPFGDGTSPSGLHVADGDFIIPADAAKQNHTIFVTYTNVAGWWEYYTGTPGYKPSQMDFRYQLRWHVRWHAHQQNTDGKCGGTGGTTSGHIFFNLERPENPETVGKIADIMQAPECPAFSGSVQILPNPTMPDCPIIERWSEPVEGKGNPCAVKVDKALLSSVSSEASRLAIPPATSSEVMTSTSTDGGRALRPMQTALAAACVLCGLAL